MVPGRPHGSGRAAIVVDDLASTNPWHPRAIEERGTAEATWQDTVSRASERQRRAVEELDIQPGDRVLELGCGHGVAASLVCDKLGPGGHLTAIDRSPKMIEAASSRNAEHVAAGRATLLCTTFEEANFGDQRFDKVFGIHFPPADRHDPAGTRARVGQLLETNGIVRWF